MRESEALLEERLMKQLEDLGYERVSVRNHDEMLDNLHAQLNWLNADVLDTPLTNAEFERLYREVGAKGVFWSAVILQDQHVFRRDSGKSVYLSFLKNNFRTLVTSVVS